MDDIINLAAIEVLEEVEINYVRGRAAFQPFNNPFIYLSDDIFRKKFRLTKELTADLIRIVEPYLREQSRRSSISVERKVLLALRFYAAGSYQLDVGNNISFGLCQSSASNCIAEVTDALNRPEIFNAFVKFPENFADLQRLRAEFYNKHQFPGVIGCIDCTHVAIYTPKKDDPMYPEAVYVNRKGYHSINVQLICDASLRILNVNARYPGSCHDSFIWNASNVQVFMKQLHQQGHDSFFLLGDSGYALRSWMMTPIGRTIPNTPEAFYDERQMSTRSIIERCNGVLKLRFRCLLKDRVLHYSPEKASKIINACVVLHNICIENNIPPVEINDEYNFDFGMYGDAEAAIEGAVQVVNPELAAGRRMQQNIIRNYFN